MSKISFEGAKDFLENISEKDSVMVIHHDDGDGFCSGVIYYEWCENRGASVDQITYTINKTKLKDFDLSKFNKLIVTDLASDFMAEELADIRDKEILFLDHHPEEKKFTDNVSYLITTKDGYIPASRTAGELTGLKPLLSLTGTITDMGQIYPENDEFIKKYLDKFGITLDFFTKRVSSVISNTICYFGKKTSKIFKTIRKIKTLEDIDSLKEYSDEVENDIQRAVREYNEKKEKLGNINFYYFEPKFSIKGVVAAIISRENLDGVYIFATPVPSGHGKISLSAREDTNKNLDLSEMLKKTVEKLEGSNAGGHPRAAGGSILKKDLEEFKENVRNFMNSKNN